ncbi:MAG: peptidase vanX D-ala-D-ala dipeptidase [Gemmatimonadetes bacterium]|nr:peptidase vanX D-ala-D-ala dipeptidase [Gemmatimonadota bacterium]
MVRIAVTVGRPSRANRARERRRVNWGVSNHDMLMPRSLSGRSVILLAAYALAGCARPHAVTQTGAAVSSADRSLLPGPMPADAPPRFRMLLGEYDAPLGMRVVFEDNGRMWLADTTHVGGKLQHAAMLTEVAEYQFGIEPTDARLILGPTRPGLLIFEHGAGVRPLAMVHGGVRMPRRDIEPEPGTTQLRVTPVRPVEQVRVEALAASPPAERGPFRTADLVELTKLDPTIKLEIRYATTNNFLGTRFYDEARAFMQRRAAEALVRAHQALRPLGYGLLIHDAYRPWYVTKMFWDATPDDKRWLVANPAQGSRHNRGAAVDLTLYELATGKPVEMPSTYDESTDRAYADYPGGTSRERWFRKLLRNAMEAQGYAVNPTEWWHFDYAEWRFYPIGNIAFDKIGT